MPRVMNISAYELDTVIDLSRFRTALINYQTADQKCQIRKWFIS